MHLTFPPSWVMGYPSSWAVPSGEKHGLSPRWPIRPAAGLAQADAAQPAGVCHSSGEQESSSRLCPRLLGNDRRERPWNRAALSRPSAVVKQGEA